MGEPFFLKAFAMIDEVCAAGYQSSLLASARRFLSADISLGVQAQNSSVVNLKSMSDSAQTSIQSHSPRRTIPFFFQAWEDARTGLGKSPA